MSVGGLGVVDPTEFPIRTGADSVVHATAGRHANVAFAPVLRRGLQLRSVAIMVGMIGLSAPAVAQTSAQITLNPFYQTATVNSGPDYNPFYYVNVAIGSPTATKNSVLVDTGSTGLYILQGALDPGSYTLTPTQFTYGYSSGNQITGQIGYATVYFPESKDSAGNVIALATAAPIAFGVITYFGCNSSNPNCPGYRAISSTTNPNNYGWNVNQTGVMGVAYSGGQAIFNPLAQLSGTYANGFLFQANQATGTSSPVLVVGLTAENTAGYTFANFASQGSTGGNIGLNAWNTKSIVTCFTASGSTGCLQSIFDSGAGNATFETAATGGANSTTTGSVSGPVTISVDGVMSFTSNLGNYNYAPEHGGTLGYNTGNEIFLYYTVAYDYVNGRIGFLPVGNILAGNTAFTSDSQLGQPGAGVILLGSVTLGPSFVSSRAFNLAQSGYLELGTPTIIVNGSATLNGTLSSANSGAVAFQGLKGQTNTLTLNGVNLFSSTLPVGVKDLNLVVNGVLPGAVALGNNATLGGSGLIVGSVSVGASAAIAPGNSIGTLGVLGGVTFKAGSTYSVEIGAPGTSDLLTLSGQAQLDGGTVSVTPYPGLAPTLGAYTILTAAGGVTGTFSGVSGAAFGTVGSAYPFLTPSLAYTPTSVLLELGRSAVTYASTAQSPNQAQVAAAADRLPGSNPVNIALSGLNAVTAPAAFNSLSGELYGSVQTGLQQQSILLRDAATSRVRQAFAQGAEPAATAAKTADLSPGGATTLWGQAYGGWGETYGTGNAAGLSSSIGGFLMGIDRPLGEAWRVGLLGGYSQSTFDVDARSSSASSDNYDVGAYAGARFGDLGLRFGATYTWHDLAANRSVVVGSLVNAVSSGYQAGTAQVFGEAGYSFHFGATTAEPFANLAYVHLSTNGVTETGGAAALTLQSGSFETTYSVLGLRLSQAVPIGTGAPLLLSGSLGWQHAFGDLTPTTTAVFAGSTPFSVSGLPLAQDAALVDIGFGYSPRANIDIGLHYVGQIAASAQSGGVKGVVSVKF